MPDKWAQYAVPTDKWAQYAQPSGLPAGADGPLPGMPSAPVPAGLQGPATPPTTSDKLLSAAATGADVGIGAAKGALHTVTAIPAAAGAKLNSALGYSQPPSVLNRDALYAPSNTAQSVGRGLEQAGEFLLPGAAEDAAMTKLAPYVGKAAPLLKAGLAATGAGAVNKAQGGDFSTGAMAGGAGSAVGQGLQRIAPIIAESALGVTGANRMYGRTVGDAILNDTGLALRPSTIEDAARAKIGELKPQVEQIAQDAGQAGGRGSLSPALSSVDQRIASHTGNRAMNSASELTPLKSFLQTDAATGLPLADAQTPTGLLRLKRGLDSDFIGNWNPTRNTNNELDAAKSAYGKLADEFHSAAPGTQDLDQRISSLIPVADRANRTSLGAGMVQNTLNRFRTPTGALVGMFGGGEEGFRRGGLPGALGGAAIGAALPALIGSPEAQMFAARSMNGVLPRLAVPMAVGGALQLKRGLNTNPPD